MRIVSVFALLVMLCSCSNNVRKPPVITDGFSCTVTVDYGDRETEFALKKEGTTVCIEYISPSDAAGLTIEISPAGNILRYKGLTHTLDGNSFDMGINGALIDALDFDYTAAEYVNHEYVCGYGNDKFKVTVFDDGRISTVNFTKFNCICYFNY